MSAISIVDLFAPARRSYNVRLNCRSALQARIIADTVRSYVRLLIALVRCYRGQKRAVDHCCQLICRMFSPSSFMASSRLWVLPMTA